MNDTEKFILAPRLGYLPLLVPLIKPFFSNSLPPGVDTVWLEHKGLPLKWDYKGGFNELDVPIVDKSEKFSYINRPVEIHGEGVQYQGLIEREKEIGQVN